MKKLKNILKTIVIMAIVFGCTNNSENTQEDDNRELDILNKEIVQLIAEGTCTENTECDFIAFGSKPCGGSWSYLVFSTAIDIELLKEKVATYNEKETAYNEKWGIFSDCMFVLPPSSVECINGTCTAIY
jgi:hypothetical protein